MEDDAVSSAMDRVVPVPGDLSRPLLGLNDSDFKASILPRVFFFVSFCGLVKTELKTLEDPKPLPILNPSNFPPETGFQSLRR